MRAQHALRLAGLVAFAFASAPVGAQRAKPAGEQPYLTEPTPPGIGVAISEIEGPVFTDAQGRTLYRWPLHGLRNGDVGDRRNAPSNCNAEVYTVNSGLMSPYPPGLRLPDAATRKSCQQEWPPVLAAADAAAIGKWSVIPRKDGSKQWTYEGFPLYTSTLDQLPGDTLGGTNRIQRGPDGPGQIGRAHV